MPYETACPAAEMEVVSSQQLNARTAERTFDRTENSSMTCSSLRINSEGSKKPVEVILRHLTARVDEEVDETSASPAGLSPIESNLQELQVSIAKI